MTTRTVRYVLDKALRAVGQSTKYKTASDTDFERAYDSLVDMLDFWENDKGLLLYGNRPSNIDSVFGTEDPVIALWTNLVIYIADDFSYDYTPQQSARADDSLRTIRNRLNGLPRMNRPSRMPRGSNNSWYNYYFLNPDGTCCSSCECDDGDTCTDCSKIIVTNNNGALAT